MSGPPGIRSFVTLDSRETRCLVLDRDNQVLHRLRAFELTSARKLPAYDVYAEPYGPEPGKQDVKIAMRVLEVLSGHCCYALYCKSGLVKLGHSYNVFQRWKDLETRPHDWASDGPKKLLQLVAVWRLADLRERSEYEDLLHQQFADHRRIGEWFEADPVLSMLKNVAQQKKSA